MAFAKLRPLSAPALGDWRERATKAAANRPERVIRSLVAGDVELERIPRPSLADIVFRAAPTSPTED